MTKECSSADAVAGSNLKAKNKGAGRKNED